MRSAMASERRGTMTTTMALCIAYVVYGLALPPRALCGAQEDRGTPVGDRIELGRLATGPVVSFVRGPSGQWGVEINGPTLRLIQTQPARVEVFKTDDDIRQVAAGYKSVTREAGGVRALAELAYGPDVVFRMTDRWSISGSILSMQEG